MKELKRESSATSNLSSLFEQDGSGMILEPDSSEVIPLNATGIETMQIRPAGNSSLSQTVDDYEWSEAAAVHFEDNLEE